MFKVRTKLQREYSYFCRYLNFITTQCRITWTLLASDMKAIESFCMKCQQRIFRIRWHNFAQNTGVSWCTGLLPVSDRNMRG